jgi:hypothetical protein
MTHRSLVHEVLLLSEGSHKQGRHIPLFKPNKFRRLKAGVTELALLAASCLSQSLTNHIATGRWSAHTCRSPREGPQAPRQPTVRRRSPSGKTRPVPVTRIGAKRSLERGEAVFRASPPPCIL